MLFVLRQVVGDGEPRRLGADENVVRRAYGRVVDEGSHRDMHEAAVTHDGIEERAASLAVRVVGVLLAEDHKLARAFGYGELRALNPCERLERRTCRPPAVGAVAVRGIEELVRHGVFHRAAIAFAGEGPAYRSFTGDHGVSHASVRRGLKQPDRP